MKTKKLIALVTAACLAGPTLAGGGEPQGLLYLNMPFGEVSARETPASFGFMLRQGSDAIRSPAFTSRHVPIVDFRFSTSGDRSFRALGLETYRFRANEESVASPTPPAEVNWWLVGGVAAAAVAVIANEERKSKNQSSSNTPGIGGGGL